MTEVYQRRVQRLLDGDFSSSHLFALILFLRDRLIADDPKVLCPGVLELGHFLAHPSQRKMGPTADKLDEIYHFLNFKLATRTLDRSALPGDFARILTGRIFAKGANAVYAETGLSWDQARQLLDQVVGLIQENQNGTISAVAVSGRDEIRLIDCLLSTRNPRTTFTASSLFGDFKRGLVAQGFLQPDRLEEFAKVERPLALFAAAMMNDVTISTDLLGAKLMISTKENRLLVETDLYIQFDGGRVALSTIPVFDAECPVAEALDSSVSLDQRGRIPHPVDLDPSGRLRTL